MIRAFLLARATAALFLPHRVTNACSHRLRRSSFPSIRRITDRAPWTSSVRRYVSPRLLIPSRTGLSPVVCWRGTNPRLAANGVVFDVAGIEAAPIRDEAEYAGVRVRTSATIAGASLSVQIDVGFGDAITPDPVEIEYPALLEAPAPVLRAYPPETVVAEKLEAIVSLGVVNSRMKDFYDLWMIAQTFTFEGAVLAKALQQTFERRRTSWPEQIPSGLGEAFANERDAQWRAFLTRDRLAAAPASLIQVNEDLRTFLQPVLAWQQLASWPPGGPWGHRETAS